MKNELVNNKKEQENVNNNPTMNIIIGGVYEKKDNEREYLVVEGFTAYDSENRYLGSEEFPIYHALVKYTCAERINGETHFITRGNMRLAVDYIASEFKKIGVNLIK